MVPGIIGTMQASEAVKLITGIGEPLIDKLFTWNALSNESFTFAISSKADTRSLIPATEPAFRETDYAWLCGENEREYELDAAGFDLLRAENGVVIIDIREVDELPAIDEFEHVRISSKMVASRIGEFGAVPIVLVCQTGQRSLAAVKSLRAAGGYKNIFSLAGGILTWKRR
jgi:adenylyltransferase/sulfurtransferase